MNLVGKILVVALFVMSLVFSAFTLAVHSTHKNWKDQVVNQVASPGKPLGLQPQLDNAKAEITRLQNDIADKERTFERNKREYQQRLGQLESTLAELTKTRDVLQDENGKLAKDLQAAIAAADEKTKLLDSIRQENSNLRADIDKVKKERDDKLADVVRLQDRVAQLASEYDRLIKRNTDLVKDITRIRVAMQDAGIQLDRKPSVYGLVRATRVVSADYEVVEISVGKDDGLEEGMEMDVYRLGTTEGRYLGRIKLTRVESDVSVGVVDPKRKKGTIQRHDHVATRLSVRAN